MRMLFVLVSLLLLVAAASSAQAQTFFKWVDDQGTVHFTAEPPQDRAFERVDTTGNVIGTSSDMTFENNDDEPVEQTDESLMPREGEPDPEEVAARCEQARENLFWLQNRRRIAVEKPDGSEEFVQGDDRITMMEETQAFIDEWCQGG